MVLNVFSVTVVLVMFFMGKTDADNTQSCSFLLIGPLTGNT